MIAPSLAALRADYIARLDDTAARLRAGTLDAEARKEALEMRDELCERLQELDEEEADAAREAEVAA